MYGTVTHLFELLYSLACLRHELDPCRDEEEEAGKEEVGRGRLRSKGLSGVE
jgi:hypothetical protein